MKTIKSLRATLARLAITAGATLATQADIEKRLTAAQYAVLREEGTEYAFSSPLDREKRKGVFRCVCCGTALFDSAADVERAHRLLRRPALVGVDADGLVGLGADLRGLARHADVLTAFPGSKRTALRFRDGAYCGCNLFAFLTPAGRRAPVAAGRFDGRPWTVSLARIAKATASLASASKSRLAAS